MISALYSPFQHWSEKGTIWVYSDTHFADENLASAFHRPSDEEQIKRINSFVGKHDTLLHLGDVGDTMIAAKLHGHKILITGNHDKGIENYKDVFEEIYRGPLFIAEKLLLSHERIDFPFAFNIHGHDHNNQDRDSHHINVCSDVCSYTPFNLNQFFKKGGMSAVQSIHRDTIDKAAARKHKENQNSCGEL